MVIRTVCVSGDDWIETDVVMHHGFYFGVCGALMICLGAWVTRRSCSCLFVCERAMRLRNVFQFAGSTICHGYGFYLIFVPVIVDDVAEINPDYCFAFFFFVVTRHDLDFYSICCDDAVMRLDFLVFVGVVVMRLGRNAVFVVEMRLGRYAIFVVEMRLDRYAISVVVKRHVCRSFSPSCAQDSNRHCHFVLDLHSVLN